MNWTRAIFLTFWLLIGTLGLAQTSSSLEAQGDAFFKNYEYAKAIESFQKALEASEPNRSEERTATLNQKLGNALLTYGKHREAEPPLMKALEIREQRFGPNDLKTAETYFTLGRMYRYRQYFSKAVGFYEKALEARQKELSPESLDLTDTQLEYGLTLVSRALKGDVAEGEKLIRQAVNAFEKAFGPEHPDTARAYGYLAWILRGKNQYQSALELSEKAAKTLEKTLGSSHLQTAYLYVDIANTLDIYSRYSESEQYYRKALITLNRIFDNGSYRSRYVYLSLANTAQQLGNYARAFELLSEVEPVIRRDFTENSLQMAAYYEYIADLFYAVGDIARGSENFLQGFNIVRTLFPQTQYDPQIEVELARWIWLSVQRNANYRNETHKDTEEIAEFLRFLDTVQASFARHLEPDDFRLSFVPSTKALLYKNTGEYEKALELYLKQAEDAKKEGPSRQEILAETYLGIGELEHKLGRLGNAKVYMSMAIEMREGTLGSEHPKTHEAQRALIRVYWQEGKKELAITQFRQIVQVGLARDLKHVYGSLDVDGVARYNIRNRLDIRELGAMLLNSNLNSPSLRYELLGHWLSQKGTTALLNRGIAILAKSTGQQAQLAKQFQQVSTELASHVRTQPESQSPEVVQAWEDKRSQLERQRTTLERQLAAQIPLLRTELALQQIEPLSLQKQLRPGEVYLDFIFSFGETIAFLVKPVGAVEMFEIPGGFNIEESVTKLRQMLGEGRILGEIKPTAAQLYASLLKPMASHLAGTTRLVVSPDGPLHELPFEMLFDGERWLLERVSVRYIPSARELIRLGLEQTPTAVGPAAVFGNPDFAGTAKAVLGQSRGLFDLDLGTALSTERLPPLPATELEAKSIAAQLGQQTRLFLGAEASEQNLVSLKSPRVLHIATHGFSVQTGPPVGAVSNPLQYSGIALSGAKRGVTEGEGVGLVSGLQLAQLDLEGTELVVLSACDTGLGAQTLGEGALGLNSAFLSAGAKRVILSLWKVPDQETAEFMQAFYRRYLGGADPSIALRDTKLEMMRKGQSPKAWAAFVLSGK